MDMCIAFPKVSWRRKWQPTSEFLPGESHGQRSLMGYSPWGHRVGHNWTNFIFSQALGGSILGLLWIAKDSSFCIWTGSKISLWIRVPSAGNRSLRPASLLPYLRELGHWIPKESCFCKLLLWPGAHGTLFSCCQQLQGPGCRMAVGGVCCEGCWIHALKPWAFPLLSSFSCLQRRENQTLESTGTCFLLHTFRIRSWTWNEWNRRWALCQKIMHVQSRQAGALWWRTVQPHPRVLPHSTPCGLSPTPHIFSSLSLLLISILLPSASPLHPISLQFPPPDPWEGGLRAGDPAAWGFRSLPSACPSLLFSFPCNSRGQVRCASKHCNHILNGNEMCELNVNYSRIEGQSLLVKVWHLVLQTFPKCHNWFPQRVMRGCNYVTTASAMGDASYWIICVGGLVRGVAE